MAGAMARRLAGARRWRADRPLPASLVVVAVACGGEERRDLREPSCDATIESLRTEVFSGSCASATCHSADAPAAALDLESHGVESGLVGVASGTCDGWARVVPGDPGASLLWRKLYSEEPPCGDPMPLGAHLSAVELGCVRAWIDGLPALEPPDGGCETCGGAACVDLMSDAAHCGSCGSACPPGSACSAGTCACSGDLALCGERCVDTVSNLDHCGGCDRRCGSGALCNVGECVCSSGLSSCGDACVDQHSDPNHCGSCGSACSAAEFCLLGSCAAGCGALSACGQSCVDTQTSVTNCGACGVQCASGAACVGGSCACPGGTANCAGACLNVLSDPSNCGACGVRCGSGQVCNAGTCACPGGGTPCGGTCVDAATDPSNCGACGIVCATGQSCVAGACTCTASGPVSFAGVVQPIFTRSCALRGCHAGVRPQANLDLAVGRSHGELVGVASAQCSPPRLLVTPGDPGRSYLMNKLGGTGLCFGTQMPKAGTSLAASELDAIGAWICAGARND